MTGLLDSAKRSDVGWVDVDAEDDERLVAAALTNDAGARRRLATRLLATIQREVVAVLRRAALAQGRDPRQEVMELTQDVLVLLFESEGRELRRWEPTRGRNLDSFVRLVARRRVARILGQRRGNPWADEPFDPQPSELAGSAGPPIDDTDLVRQLEDRSLLGRVLDELHAHMSPRDAELFHALFVEERDPQDVAQALGMTRGAVNAWSYRIRKLARNLAGATIDDSASSPGRAPTKDSTSHG